MKIHAERFINKKLLKILAVLAIVLAIPLTVFIAQKQQELRKQAATTELGSFPKPSSDTGIGMHWSAATSNGYDVQTAQRAVCDLKALGVSWIKIVADGQSAVGFARFMKQNDIEPIVRLYRPTPLPSTLPQQDLESVSAYVQSGVSYFESTNEPNVAVEWEGQQIPDPQIAVQKTMQAWVQDALHIQQRGGFPLFPSLSPGGTHDDIGFLRDSLTWLQNNSCQLADGSTDACINLFNPTRSNGKPAVMSIHNYNLNHDNSRNPDGSINFYTEDSNAFLKFITYDTLIKSFLGRSIPILSTEDGMILDENQDNRFPQTDAQWHKDVTLAMAAYQMNNTSPYFFNTAFWLAMPNPDGFWEKHAWLKGDLTPQIADTINALKTLPKKTRSGGTYNTSCPGVPEETGSCRDLRPDQTIPPGTGLDSSKHVWRANCSAPVSCYNGENIETYHDKCPKNESQTDFINPDSSRWCYGFQGPSGERDPQYARCLKLEYIGPTTQPTSPTGETIDTLDYFLTNHPDKGLTGTHPLSQTIDGKKLYLVKWSPTNFEIHTWDNDYIYLKEDNSGQPVNFYTFTPGTWMKRQMRVGEKITVSNNIIQWYTPTCQPDGQTRSFPIEMTLEQHDPNFDIGGDLGRQDVIVLKYDSALGSTSGIYERIYYSKEWGFILWEEYDKATNTKRHTSTFNKITDTPTNPDKNSACDPSLRPPAVPSATPTITLTPTVTVTPTVTPSPTPRPGTTQLALTFVLHGIGQGGDNVTTQNNLSNKNPRRTTREVTVQLLNASNQEVARQTVSTTFQSDGRYTASASFTNIASGNYFIKAKMGNYLTKLVPGVQTLTAGESKQLPQIALVAGDVNNDNALDALDWNILIGCFSEERPAKSCDASKKDASDLTDDGQVTLGDVNLFLRELSVRSGD